MINAKGVLRLVLRLTFCWLCSRRVITFGDATGLTIRGP